jgi:hypothetical protein
MGRAAHGAAAPVITVQAARNPVSTSARIVAMTDVTRTLILTEVLSERKRRVEVEGYTPEHDPHL